MQEGLTKYKGQMFKVMTESGEITIVPSALANDIRNEPNLNFMKAIAEDFHSHLPGFEAFAGGTRSDALIQTMARKQLTKSLSTSIPLLCSVHADCVCRQSDGTPV